jgi:hypothetical protein
MPDVGRPSSCNPCCACHPVGTFTDSFDSAIGNRWHQEHPCSAGTGNYNAPPRYQITSGKLDAIATGPIAVCMKMPDAPNRIIECSAKFYPDNTIAGAMGVWIENMAGIGLRATNGDLTRSLGLINHYGCGTSGFAAIAGTAWASGDTLMVRVEQANNGDDWDVTYLQNGITRSTNTLPNFTLPAEFGAGILTTGNGDYDDFTLFADGG